LGTIRDAVDDLRAAFEWVRTNARQHRIDAERIALAGGSAGGIAVLNLCHHPEQPVDRRHGVCAVMGLWGTPGQGSRLFAALNPYGPATLLVHGDADTIVPYEQSVSFAQELVRAGIDHELLTLPGAGHTPMQHRERMAEVIARFLSGRLGV
jgi:dipeptidyl aminopeptidase/acylaminoacyl peptidase